MTTATANEWGPRLAAYLTEHLRARGITVNRFADTTPGIAGSDVSRWRTGTEPTIEKFRAVANGLNVSIVDVLLAVGVLTRDDIDREPAPIPVPDLDAAITADPRLTDWSRRHIRDIIASIIAVQSGQSDMATVTVGTAEPAKDAPAGAGKARRANPRKT